MIVVNLLPESLRWKPSRGPKFLVLLHAALVMLHSLANVDLAVEVDDGQVDRLRTEVRAVGAEVAAVEAEVETLRVWKEELAKAKAVPGLASQVLMRIVATVPEHVTLISLVATSEEVRLSAEAPALRIIREWTSALGALVGDITSATEPRDGAPGTAVDLVGRWQLCGTQACS